MFVFTWILKNTLKVGAVGAVVLPLYLLLVGYARDAVRLFNASQVEKGIEIYNLDKGKGRYPPNIQTLVDVKLMKTYPTDPINYLNNRDLKKLSQLVDPQNIKKLENIKNIDDVSKIIKTQTGNQNTLSGELEDKDEKAVFFINYKTGNESKSYEISSKFESMFFQKRMLEDGGNDPDRYELGTDLKLDTSVKSSFNLNSANKSK